MEQMGEIGFDVSKVLGPGVYILRARGRVTFVGRARRQVMTQILAHQEVTKGTWFPGLVRPVKFDSVEVIPCPEHLQAEVWKSTCVALAWSPKQVAHAAA